MPRPEKPKPADRLRSLADALDDLNDDDKELVAGAAELMRAEIDAVLHLRESAHVHDTAHTGDKAVCCDCRRGLISDAGTERILICPQLHGKRSRDHRPTKPEGAVECGRER